MSREALDALLEGMGFEDTPLEIDLPAFHVPYDDRNRTGIESGIRDAARRGERIGVAGPIGAGKTSVKRFALDDLAGDVAPIWVSVARDGDAVIGEPAAFLRHVIQAAERHARKADLLAEDERAAVLAAATERRPLPTTARRVAGKVGARFWIARAEVGRDVTTTIAAGDLRRPLADLHETADRVLEAIGAHGLQPVLVIDDSDAFTRSGVPERHDARIEAFFGPVLAEVRKLRCGMVVAIHEEYFQRASYQRARDHFGVLQRAIAVPEIVSGQLRRILARRVALTCGAGIDDVIAPGGVERLAEINRGPARRNLRTVLAIAHEALVAAVGDDRELIDAADVVGAAAKHL